MELDAHWGGHLMEVVSQGSFTVFLHYRKEQKIKWIFDTVLIYKLLERNIKTINHKQICDYFDVPKETTENSFSCGSFPRTKFKNAIFWFTIYKICCIKAQNKTYCIKQDILFFTVGIFSYMIFFSIKKLPIKNIKIRTHMFKTDCGGRKFTF